MCFYHLSGFICDFLEFRSVKFSNISQILKKKKVGYVQASAPRCDYFGRHGEWKKYLATKILAKVANW